MPVVLSEKDRQMLNGEHGEANKLAMSILVRMAGVYDATEMMDVTQAHIDGCGLLSETSLEFAETLAALGGRVAIPTTLNMVPLDLQKMLRNNVSLALGTDNGMLHPPSILAEIRCVLNNFTITHSQALDMALLFKDRYQGIPENGQKGGKQHQHQPHSMAEARREQGYLYPGSWEGFMVVEEERQWEPLENVGAR